MTTPSKPPKKTSSQLRQRAEAQLEKQAEPNNPSANTKSTKRMLQELQVHRIELEMQNEELQRAQLAEKESSQRYTDLFEFAPIAYFVIDLNGIISQVNLRGASLLGIERANLVGEKFDNHIITSHKNVFHNCLENVFEGEGIQSCEILVQADNRTFWLTIEASLDDNKTHCLTAMIDITERKLAEDKLKLAASVFSHAHEGIFITDASGSILEVNDRFTDITGYSRTEALGQNPRLLQSGKQLPAFYTEMWRTLQEQNHWHGELWNRHKNGEIYAEQLTISAVRDVTDQVQNYVAFISDITEIKAHQDQLEHIAHYDVLTNLPNRALLADRLNQSMMKCSRHRLSLVVAFLDLDGFKLINDAHGHHLGDQLLVSLSARMKEALREGDTLARIGGDEFVAIISGLSKIEDCQPVLDRLLHVAATPVTVMGTSLKLSTSIGVALYPQDNIDADQLLRQADQAMYLAKQAGKNRYHFFDTIRDKAVITQRENIESVRDALSRGEFVLYYQPKVNMRSGEIIGVEALIRWQHPNQGLLPPAAFLPMIESHDISLGVGEWVIDTALTQIHEWEKAGIHLPISVNISAYQLQQKNFSSRLAALLSAHPEVNPQHLELEILETSALSDISDVSATMQACSQLGVTFSLDDFGTGYSSLTYLRSLPVSVIKIDQSFIRDMLTNPDDLAIVTGVMGLAKAFNREVIAEGVETIEHGVALIALGCELAQGYGIARPMAASDVPTWIKDWKPDASWQP